MRRVDTKLSPLVSTDLFHLTGTHHVTAFGLCGFLFFVLCGLFLLCLCFCVVLFLLLVCVSVFYFLAIDVIRE